MMRVEPGSNAEVVVLLAVAVAATVVSGLVGTSWRVSITATVLTLLLFVPVLIARRRYHR
jgi:uncharacterized membrane protein YjjP (DUF1212 family)